MLGALEHGDETGRLLEHLAQMLALGPQRRLGRPQEVDQCLLVARELVVRFRFPPQTDKVGDLLDAVNDQSNLAVRAQPAKRLRVSPRS